MKSFEKAHCLKQIVDQCTRLTSSGSTQIDLIFTDCPHVSEAGILNSNLSDHLPIYFVRKKEREKVTKNIIWGRSYRGYDREFFLRLFIGSNWTFYNDNVIKALHV